MDNDVHKGAVKPVPRYVSYGTFTVGVLLFIATFVLCVYLYRTRPDPFRHVWTLFIMGLVGGRAATCGLGLELNFSRQFLLFQSVITDMVVMFLAYGLFVGNFHRLASLPVVGRPLVAVHELALKHKDRIAKYGSFGLMVFVLFPVWSTGPLVGVIIGFILGMSTLLSFSVVMAGNVAATAAWIWFFHFLKAYSGVLGRAILIGVVVLALGMTIYRRVRDWWRHYQLRKLEKAVAERERATAGQRAGEPGSAREPHEVPGTPRAKEPPPEPDPDAPRLVPYVERPRPKPLQSLGQTVRKRRELLRRKGGTPRSRPSQFPQRNRRER